jgi:polyferredoxin
METRSNTMPNSNILKKVISSASILEGVKMSSTGPLSKKTYSSTKTIRSVIQVIFIAVSLMSIFKMNLVIIGIIMIVSFFGGAWFCGWVCPFGTVQDWIGLTGKKLLKKRIIIPHKLERILSWLRYLLLGLSLAGFTASAFLSSSYQIFTGLLAGSTTYIEWVSWVLLAFFLCSSLLIDRPFCRYFCLEGAGYGLLSMLRIFTITRKTEKCSGCKVCDKACPIQVNISSHSHVRHPGCINCLNCIQSCPVKGCLSYKSFMKFPAGKKEQRNETHNS